MFRGVGSGHGDKSAQGLSVARLRVFVTVVAPRLLLRWKTAMGISQDRGTPFIPQIKSTPLEAPKKGYPRLSETPNAHALGLML